jgi:hypothetical protein
MITLLIIYSPPGGKMLEEKNEKISQPSPKIMARNLFLVEFHI